MIDFRSNKGLTLVELLVTIIVASVVTLAATTILLLGLRIHSNATQTAGRQNEIRVAMTVVNELVAENAVQEGSGIGDPVLLGPGGTVLLKYSDRTLSTGNGAVLLEDVDNFEVDIKDSLLTYIIEADGQEYTAAVYCRVDETINMEGVLWDNLNLSPKVRNFLNTMHSQLGSDGRIIENGVPTNTYYAQWYNSSWGADTAWCACFVSWAMDACGGFTIGGENACYANVDSFLAAFVEADQWKTESPNTGDIIFFDWIVDSERNAQHVGVVLAEKDGYVYTIEGNRGDRAVIYRYASDSPYILAYGMLDPT